MLIDQQVKNDLSFILWHECPGGPSPKHEGYNVYEIEGHCVQYRIHAKFTDSFRCSYDVAEIEVL